MKKLYIEPEFELMSIRLLADVLGPSQHQKETEVEMEDETQDVYEPTSWDEIEEI